MIRRNEYQGELALGKRVKTTAVATLDSVTELSQTIADTITTARSAIELVHGALQLPIMEQRIELAQTVQQGLKDLVTSGMTKQEACDYLQVPYVPTEVRVSGIASAASAIE